MSTYSKFEDLKVWADSRKLNKLMSELIASKEDRNSGYLINHLFKTAGSVMDNIAEGFEREGNKEFINFLSISKGSAGELRSQFYRALDFAIINKNEFDILTERAISISVQLSFFMKYLKSSTIKGNKFKEPAGDYTPTIDLSQFFLPEEGI